MATSENTAEVKTRITPRAKATLQAEARRLGLTDAAYLRVVLLERAAIIAAGGCALSAPLKTT